MVLWLAALLKIAALVSAIWTSLLAVVILGWQMVAWMLTGEWAPFSVSTALALAGHERPEIDVTGSTGPSSSDVQRITDWLLDLPASGVLLAVAAILVAFSISAAAIEREFSGTEE
jgi:hypothetical protein